MRFTMQFDCDNEAFAVEGMMPLAGACDEVARILRAIADRLEDETGGDVRDINGNSVGFWGLG